MIYRMFQIRGDIHRIAEGVAPLVLLVLKSTTVDRIRPGIAALAISREPSSRVLDIDYSTRCSMLGAFKETILVVDDNEIVLTTVAKILAAARIPRTLRGRRSCCPQAGGRNGAQIDLLLSDVEMPGMSGPDLGEALKKERPDIHVMLMSGGSNGNLLVLNYGWAYIQKPFLAVKLIQMITDVLYSPNRSQPGGQEFDSRKDQSGQCRIA